jgi:hypothetical protein
MIVPLFLTIHVTTNRGNNPKHNKTQTFKYFFHSSNTIVKLLSIIKSSRS